MSSREAALTPASHAWDLAGAKACGFVTAYTKEYEQYENEEIWGKADIVSDDLADMGRQIVAKYGKGD